MKKSLKFVNFYRSHNTEKMRSQIQGLVDRDRRSFGKGHRWERLGCFCTGRRWREASSILGPNESPRPLRALPMFILALISPHFAVSASHHSLTLDVLCRRQGSYVGTYTFRDGTVRSSTYDRLG
ncbi:hypothetical protein K439DRAFT_1630087, partial [Ramaria rubella]